VGTAARESRAPEAPRRNRGARRLVRKRRRYVRAFGFFRDRGIGDGKISTAVAAVAAVAAAPRVFWNFPQQKETRVAKGGRRGEIRRPDCIADCHGGRWKLDGKNGFCTCAQ